MSFNVDVAITPSSFRDAPLGAGPESILPMVVMDSGLVASRRPGMTADRESRAGTKRPGAQNRRPTIGPVLPPH
jgi:hypothetical protein